MNRLLSGPLTIESVTVPIQDLPPELNGVRIVQLSDFHYDGLRLSESMLSEAIARTNQLKPDLIVLTGDFVTTSPSPIHKLANQLQTLQSRCGVYAILGNHDLYTPASRQVVTQALEKICIPVLWNTIAYPFGSDFPLVGLADFWSGEFHKNCVLGQIEPDKPRLVLSHNPDSVVPLSHYRVDLQLSGHTHGGQVVLPGLGNGPLLMRRLRRFFPAWLREHLPFMSEKCNRIVRHWEWAQGLHSVGKTWLYVNRGLGTYLPGRLFCPPELTVLTLVQRL
ncbi:MAG: metallophosphoesterase [Cyanobacteria bacterium P01_D01_bin.128]